LTPSDIEKSTTPLEKSVQATTVTQSNNLNNFPVYPALPSDPKDVDFNQYMKAIIDPRDELYGPMKTIR